MENAGEALGSVVNGENMKIRKDEDLENAEEVLRIFQANIDKITDAEIKPVLQEQGRNLKDCLSAISQKLATSEITRLGLEIEKEKSRADILSKYLKKELVATVVGALILLIFVVTYAICTGLGITTFPEIFNSAFLLVLGFFFGASGASKSG